MNTASPPSEIDGGSPALATVNAVQTGTTARAAALRLNSPLLRSRAFIALAFIALAVPCWWQKRMMAGDLSSHIYNAWLATLIKSEPPGAFGLRLRPMITNVAFDISLEQLMRIFGPDLAQRLAVTAVVLIFTVGAFAFVSIGARRRPWFLLPFIALLAYGWVFRMGFFNFLLSLGLCLGAFAAFVTARNKSRFIAGVGLLSVGFLAHPYPVLWIGGLAAYRFIATRLRPRFRPLLLIASALAVLAVRTLLSHLYQCAWSPSQRLSMTGADQLWTFGTDSFVFVPALLLLWGALFVRLASRVDVVRLGLAVPAQFLALNVFSVLMLPTAIYLGGDKLGFTFIAERASLFVAVCVLWMLARARPRSPEIIGATALLAIFFTYGYVQDRRLNAIEDQVEIAVNRLPRWVRVTAPILEPGRTNQTLHMIDRACVGRCFSFANYEPSSGDFRIVPSGASPIVATKYSLSSDLQLGRHTPMPEDPDYHMITRCEETNDIRIRYISRSARRW